MTGCDAVTLPSLLMKRPFLGSNGISDQRFQCEQVGAEPMASGGKQGT